MIDNSRIDLKFRIEVMNNWNFPSIFDYDTLLFNSNFISILRIIIFCHISITGIDEFINKNNYYSLNYNILKQINFFNNFQILEINQFISIA